MEEFCFPWTLVSRAYLHLVVALVGQTISLCASSCHASSCWFAHKKILDSWFVAAGVMAVAFFGA